MERKSQAAYPVHVEVKEKAQLVLMEEDKAYVRQPTTETNPLMKMFSMLFIHNYFQQCDKRIMSHLLL